MAAELLLTFALEETVSSIAAKGIGLAAKGIGLAAKGIGLAWGLEGQLRKLNQSLTMIKDVLQDAARRAVTDESVKRWLQNLQDVAYDAEDVLDEFAYEILRKDQKKGKVRDCFSLHNPVAFRLIMGQKVEKINRALDEIRKDAAGFGLGLTSLPVDRAQEVSWDPDRETHSFLDSSEVVGREDDGSAVDGASHNRHLNLVSRGDDEAVLTAVDAKKLRTVFSMVDVLNGPWKFKSLRTLKLRRSDITELPDSICKLRHLRYLDVSDTSIRALSESITKLYHLETLRFTDCESLEKLPQKVRNLVSLRHLHFDDPMLVPAEVRLLTRLQTLLIFAVGPDHMVEELGCNSSVNSEDVLEGLQPHPDIRSLTIEGYGGENFSSWILQLNNLTVLRLEGCSKLRQLPTLGCLPRLKILEMSGMPNVKCIGNEFYSSSSGSEAILFPALKKLTLRYMDGLEEWMVPGGEGDQVFPCLEELCIEGCGKLRQLPTLGCLPRLKILEMSGMPNVKCIGNEFYSRDNAGVLFPALQILTLSRMDGLEEWMVPGGEVVAVFPSLEKLSIECCGKLESIPICRLSSLVEFKIEQCDELRYLSGEFHGFTSLQVLSIWRCPKLASIPSVQHCTALVELSIYWCGELISIPGDFRDLNSLEKLRVNGCKLGALPSGLQCCASLEELSIIDCSELIHSNDFQELSSLRRLWIRGCDKLISIDWHGLRQLCSLVELQITACPSLSDIPEDDWLGGLTQLQELRIGGFSKEMEAFPVGVLNSIQHLKSLYIHGWDKLKSVPHQLQHLTALEILRIMDFDGEELEEALPEWMANLSSLRFLWIENCKNLKYMPSSTAI
uniref:Uncharacterized protein n=1 Tax=Populus alba TaxID=43335 RepID=A0A4U5PYU9_POPAL|nr:hypothetical protein D5086_0000159690 [Populus alba]